MTKWRIMTDGPGEAAWNMALDEALLTCAVGTDGAVLRFYTWSNPVVSLGYAQKADSFLNCGLPLVRRISGGRAVLHHSELTYSLVCGDGHALMGEGVLGAYKAISGVIIDALKAVGVQAELVPRLRGHKGSKQSCFNAPSSYEVSSGGRKIAGSAQKRIKGAMLQHGSILLGVDSVMYDRVFGSGSFNEAASVREFSSVTADELGNVLMMEMRGVLGDDFYRGELTEEEKGLALELEEKKYSDPEWNLGVRRGRELYACRNSQALIA